MKLRSLLMVAAIVLSGCSSSFEEAGAALDAAVAERKAQMSCYKTKQDSFKKLDFSAIAECDEQVSQGEAQSSPQPAPAPSAMPEPSPSPESEASEPEPLPPHTVPVPSTWAT